MYPEIWFWQCIVSPHMAVLAAALARSGCRVTYVTEQGMSADRTAQGWRVPALPGVDLHHAVTAEEVMALVAQAPAQAVHLCQGVRGNGLVAVAQRALARRRLRFWVLMETVDNRGAIGLVRRLVYRILFRRWSGSLQGVLATGRSTAQWVAARGVPTRQIFPFTYFLQELEAAVPMEERRFKKGCQFLFVGRLIELKRLDLLIDALAGLAATGADFGLQVVGSGPMEESLRAHGEKLLGGRLEWLGQLPMQEARQRMAAADCLVLPSRHDGWGAVVSEALMAGTPAICSDACGAAEAVLASGVGGVFPSGDRDALMALLVERIKLGPQQPAARTALARWGRSLGADAGARYLLDILAHHGEGAVRPMPPWRVAVAPPVEAGMKA